MKIITAKFDLRNDGGVVTAFRADGQADECLHCCSVGMVYHFVPVTPEALEVQVDAIDLCLNCAVDDDTLICLNVTK